MILKLKDAIEKIDQDMVREWVEDLVLANTFLGLRFQEVILMKIASEQHAEYRLATPEVESRGIDSYIGERPISIKPITYKTKDMLIEKIEAEIIYYEKNQMVSHLNMIFNNRPFLVSKR